MATSPSLLRRWADDPPSAPASARGLAAAGGAAALGLVLLVFGSHGASVLSVQVVGGSALAVAGLSWGAYALRGSLTSRLPFLSPRGLGLFRIAWGAALLYVFPTLEARTPGEVVPRELLVVDTTTDFGASAWLAEHPDAVSAIGAMTVIALVLFTAGAAARVAYLVAAVGFAALAHLVVAEHGGAHDWGLPLVTILLLVVVPWSRSGVGIDELVRRLRGRDDGRRSPQPLGLALWLPGFALGVAWLAAAHAKLDNSGVEWVTGGAVRYHFAEDALSAPVTWGAWIASHERAAIAVAAAGIVFEATFILNAAFRRPLIRLGFGLAGAGFLLGTVLFQGVRWFPWWMVLLAFVPWEPLARGLRAALPESVVLVDGNCPMCRRTASVLHGLDWFDRLQFTDANDAHARRRWTPAVGEEEALTWMAVARVGSGDVKLGYDGYVSLAAGVPVLWPLAVLGPLRPVRWLGRRIYDSIALRRRREGCTDETCRTRVLGARMLPRPAVDPVPSVLALGVCVLLCGILVVQVIASDRRLEYEPIVSNYPMYSSTFASPAAFDAARERKLSRYRLEAAGRDVSGAVAQVNGTDSLLDLAYVLREGRTPSSRLKAAVARVRREYDAAFGPGLNRVTVRIDQRAFDWERGTFVWKRRNAVLAELDLRRFALS